MATITLGVFSSAKTIDQGSYPGDEKLTVDSVAGNTTLTINNATNSNDVLDLTQTRLIPIGGTSTLNLGENAHVKISEFFDLSVGQTSNYNLGEGSTLEYSPPSIGGGAANSTTFDLGSDGTSTLIYNPGGLQLDLSSSPKIAGLSAGDQIQVNGATQGAVEGGNLVFRDDNGRVVGSFNAEGQDLSKVTFEGGTMTYACYLKGTHIATPDGEVKVETLKAGDQVLTASGGIATVKWLGFRKLNRDRIPADAQLRAAPIRIAKGALAENIPHRDLTVSPGHRFNFDGALIPALSLVN